MLNDEQGREADLSPSPMAATECPGRPDGSEHQTQQWTDEANGDAQARNRLDIMLAVEADGQMTLSAGHWRIARKEKNAIVEFDN